MSRTDPVEKRRRATAQARLVPWLLLACAALLLSFCVLRHLSHPLLWNDEAETAMYGQRVLRFGTPRVSDGRNHVYEVDVPPALGIDPDTGAYKGSTWGQYYVGALGAALAATSDDPHAQALRMRLPFALAGLAAAALAAGLVLRLHPSSRRRGVLAAAALLFLLALSVTWQLHARQARYYPLLAGVVLAALALTVRRSRLAPAPARGTGLALAATVFACFHVFHPGWLLLTGGLAADRLLAATRAAREERLRRRVRDLWPLGLAALAVVPFALWFDVVAIGRALSADLAQGPEAWLRNAARIGGYLLRHGDLALAAVARAAVLWLSRPAGAVSGGEPGGEDVALRSEAARAAWWIAGIWALGLTGLPFVFERYAFPIVPLLALAAVLDGSSALALAAARDREAGRARARLRTAAALALPLLAMVPLRGGTWAGRLAELDTPRRGPVDFVVAHLRERHPRPEELVIATNYEAPSLMFHLGSRVVVGYAGFRLAADRELEPDVVWPRKLWAHRHVPVLRAMVERGGYTRVPFPVADLPANDLTNLSPDPGPKFRHRFRTVPARHERERLVLFERRPRDD